MSTAPFAAKLWKPPAYKAGFTVVKFRFVPAHEAGLAGTMLDLRVVRLRGRTVSCRGEVRHAFRDDLIDRLRNDAVLKERFSEIDDVVDDHVGLEPGAVVRCRRVARECADVVGEAQLPGVRRREAEFRLRREIVHDLQHRAAFVGPRREVLENDHRLGVTRRIAHAREIASRDVECRAVRRRVGVVAVGHHAHRDPRAIDTRGKLVHTMLHDALAVGGADVGLHRARWHDREHTLGARNRSRAVRPEHTLRRGPGHKTDPKRRLRRPLSAAANRVSATRLASHRAKCERVRGWHRRIAPARSPSPRSLRCAKRARAAAGGATSCFRPSPRFAVSSAAHAAAGASATPNAIDSASRASFAALARPF